MVRFSMNLTFVLLAVASLTVSRTAAGAAPEEHRCVQGSHGLTWHVVQRHPTYASITATEPRNAAIYRGTIRRLPNSRLWLMALSTWGQARQQMGSWHPYALVYWPGIRPVWLILMNSPTLEPGKEVKLRCRR